LLPMVEYSQRFEDSCGMVAIDDLTTVIVSVKIAKFHRKVHDSLRDICCSLTELRAHPKEFRPP
jgi:hypothetical protein